jgi:hypothetical protein
MPLTNAHVDKCIECGYAAKDNILHLLWEQEQFLDKYLKN